MFFFGLVVAFIPGKFPKNFPEGGGKAFGVIVAVVLLIIGFMVASSQIFNTVVNWAMVRTWMATDWFGMILLLAIAGIVAWKIKK